jgi:hypothetical protein
MTTPILYLGVCRKETKSPLGRSCFQQSRSLCSLWDDVVWSLTVVVTTVNEKVIFPQRNAPNKWILWRPFLAFFPFSLGEAAIGRGAGMMIFWGALFALVNLGLAAWLIYGWKVYFSVIHLLSTVFILPVVYVWHSRLEFASKWRRQPQRY